MHVPYNFGSLKNRVFRIKLKQIDNHLDFLLKLEDFVFPQYLIFLTLDIHLDNMTLRRTHSKCCVDIVFLQINMY